MYDNGAAWNQDETLQCSDPMNPADMPDPEGDGQGPFTEEDRGENGCSCEHDCVPWGANDLTTPSWRKCCADHTILCGPSAAEQAGCTE